MTTHPQGSSFHTTRWSMVLEAGKADDRGQRALAELCGIYWYPLYAFLRRQGRDEHSAKDLTQGFFTRLIEKQDLQKVEAGRGRFRSYLLASLKHFVANEWDKARAQKRGGTQTILSLDVEEAETRYQREPQDDATPEHLFERRWALTVLNTVMTGLADEMAARGRRKVFDQLKAFLEGDASAPSYQELASDLGLTEGAIKVTVHRMRTRFRELLRREIGHTVADPKEADPELRDLLAALRRR